MSERYKLLPQAASQVPNPFVLCTVAGKRARQLIASGTYRPADAISTAVRELANGALEFERSDSPNRLLKNREKCPPEGGRYTGLVAAAGFSPACFLAAALTDGFSAPS